MQWIVIAACRRSDSLTMLYLSKTLRVLCPEIDIATGLKGQAKAANEGQLKTGQRK
jgi:hypothetical protein